MMPGWATRWPARRIGNTQRSRWPWKVLHSPVSAVTINVILDGPVDASLGALLERPIEPLGPRARHHLHGQLRRAIALFNVLGEGLTRDATPTPADDRPVEGSTHL